jgi:hypothetical protein
LEHRYTVVVHIDGKVHHGWSQFRIFLNAHGQQQVSGWGTAAKHFTSSKEDVDPALLVWDMHRRVNVDLLPEEKVVIQINFRGAATGEYWLVIERPEPSVCAIDPRLDVDLFINTDTVTAHKVWMGMANLGESVDEGLIELDGLTSHGGLPDVVQTECFLRRRTSFSR